MDEITDIKVTSEVEDGLIFFVEGIEVGEFKGEEYRTDAFDSVTLDREEAQHIVSDIEGITNREKIDPGDGEKIFSVEKNGNRHTLYIEEHDFPDYTEIENGAPFITDTFELGTATRGDTQMLKDLTYQIDELEGCAFRLEADGPQCMSAISLLFVGDEERRAPRTWFTLEPGDYHVWDECEEVEE